MLEVKLWGGEHSFLWALRHEVQDDRIEQTLSDFSTIIRRSETRCQEAEEQEDQEYRDFVCESEGEYIEEIIGACLLLSQAKIRRVTSSACEVAKMVKNKYSIDIPEFSDAKKIRGIGEAFKGTNSTAAELVWDLGNYYKHRDEWPAQVWDDSGSGNSSSRNTRVSVERLGISRWSTGNMRKALKFFDINQHSNCSELAQLIKNWAFDVQKVAIRKIEAMEKAR